VLATINPLRVFVHTAGGAAPGVTVYWSVGHDSLVARSTTTTDRAGFASLSLTFGDKRAVYAVAAALSPGETSATVAFTLTATAGHPTALRIASGANQTDTVTARLAADYVVQLTDGHGNGVPDVGIDWAVTSGGGAISSARSMTGAPDGYATARYTLGRTLGAQTVIATASELTSSPRVTFTATAIARPPSPPAPEPTPGGATVQVIARTTGVDLDPNGYSVVLSGSGLATRSADVGANATASLSGVAAGTYGVTVSGMAANCDRAGGTPQSVTVQSGGSVTVAVEVTCATAPQLAISLSLDLYLLKINGTDTVRLTTDVAGHAAWSPDGSRIAFTSHREGNYQLYVMNADGSGSRRLTTTSQYMADLHPTWSPDSRTIAFKRWTSGHQAVYVINADGTSLTRLTADSIWAGDPAWSPDGSKIAFDANFGGIFVMNPDGTGITRLTTDAAQPSWSPDGKQLVFSRGYNCTEYGGCNASLFIMNADGSGATRVTSGAYDTDAVWSPDGRWIAFASDYCPQSGPDCTSGVRLVRPDGSRLTDLVASAGPMTWRRGGKP